MAAGAFFTEDSYLGNLREPLTRNRYVYCVGNPVNYVDPSGHIMLGNTDMPGFVRGEVNGETVFYFPDSFSDYAENRLAEKAEENRRFMDGVEEFLLYNPVGQGISAASSALLFPVTGPAVLLRDQHLANTYGEARDEMADFFEVNNNLLAGFAGSFHGTYQILKDPAYLVFGAAYIIEKPNETIFRDPLERPLAMVDAFWEGDNKGAARYTGQTVGYVTQIALAMQVVRACKNQKIPKEKVPNENGPTTLNHQASSGAELTSTPGRTTTILGRYESDTGAIIEELDLPKSIDFSGNPGGFNLLNTPDYLYTELGPDGFWNAYNKPFLDAAISRGDEFIIATPIINDNLYLSNSQGLTGFGREYFYLLERGYEYMDGRMVIK